ncbi:MAG: acyl-CoA carboxylase subunit beta, partial [Cellvibrionaceae bacterium]|nr:acyl-CoA carboxylase subunit beta [Cellvibrionaceae bacterium]
MPIIESQIDSNSEEFAQNQAAMQAALDTVREIEDKVYQTELSKKERYAKRNMILPRERLAKLLDPGAPYLELSSLAGYKMYDDKDGTGAGAGSICGIGYVSGVRCMVRADNYAVKGGTVTPIGLEKALRMQQISMDNKLPCITLAQSGGANLTYAADTFAPGGRGFANQARQSAAGIPQVTVVHGSATAG